MKKQKSVDYGKEIENEFARWESLKVNGGSDPFWADGCNMNLVRNHIIYYKRKIEETMRPKEYPESYFRELPPEMPNGYMARAEEIRKHAKATLDILQRDKNYKFIKKKSVALEMDPKLCNDTGYYHGGNPVPTLEKAIREDNLVELRRYEKPEYYLERISLCAEKIRELDSQENYQFSLFEM